MTAGVRTIDWVPEPEFPLPSLAATDTVCVPVWSLCATVYDPTHASSELSKVIATGELAVPVPLMAKVTVAAETVAPPWRETWAFTYTVWPAPNVLCGTVNEEELQVDTATFSLLDIVTATWEEPLSSPCVACAAISQVPARSVLNIVYRAEYVPRPVLAREIVPPDGLFAVTVAAVAGAPAADTDAEMVATWPLLNTEPAEGLVIETDRPWTPTVICWLPLPAFPLESAADTVRVCAPCWSVGWMV